MHMFCETKNTIAFKTKGKENTGTRNRQRGMRLIVLQHQKVTFRHT